MEITPQISVAPMMEWTDRHCRYFMRLISPTVRLYTEMITTGAILHGDQDRFLRFDETEHPVALQLGGSDPDALAECTRIGADYGYDEINLNCGCPSDRVQNGAFGACLMKTPDQVARCIEAMIKASSAPVTVKCRIAVDEEEEFSFLDRFVNTVSTAGCQTFIVHARKAWLSGLSPKENREIPPLRYDIVQAIKEKHSDLIFILNGGIENTDLIYKYKSTLEGFMLGRKAYHDPYFLSVIEAEIFGNTELLKREEIARAMILYIERQVRDHGTPPRSVTRHMLNLFKGQPGGAIWRRILTETACVETALAARLRVHA